MPRYTRSDLLYVKTVRPARGGTYYYFDTGQTNLLGKKIYKRLPDKADKHAFGAAYSALLGSRTKRAEQPGQMMLIDLIKLYQKSERWRRLAENTRDKYAIYLQKLGEAFDSAPADGLERRDVVTLIDSMADRPGAANFQLKVISALYAWGRSRGHVAGRPCDDVGMLGMGEHQPWPSALLEAGLKADDALIKLAVHLLYYTGQRIGDVTMMRWSDISDGRVEILQEKTGARVSIPPHPHLAVLLAATPKVGLTILAINGRAVKRQTLRYRLQKFAEDLGYKAVPHGLRKNAVNALLEAGCSVAETGAITRQSLQLVEHYAKGRDTKKLADAAVLKWSKAKS